MPTPVFRAAEVEDASALTALARRAKASWDYPEVWLREWEPELSFSSDYIRDNAVIVAELENVVVGVVALDHLPGEPTLGHLWVSPDCQRQGLGRTLLEKALAMAADRDWQALRVESDPYAQGFYERMGAVEVGRISAPVAGTDRFLPVLRLPVRSLRGSSTPGTA